MEVLATFKTELADIDTVEDMRDRFSDAIKKLGYHGFDAFSVKTGTIEEVDQECNLFICDYGLDLPRSYVRDGWLQMDPVAAEIARTSKPFDYVEFLRGAHKNTSVVWQMGVLRLKNVHRAWLVPLCTIGNMRGMTVYMQGKAPDNIRRFQMTGTEIHLLCVEFMDEFARLSAKLTESDVWYAGAFDINSVTRRETDCLHWAAHGQTNREIGETLKISENTVRYHLKNVFAKLETNTRSNAVSRALSVGIIEV